MSTNFNEKEIVSTTFRFVTVRNPEALSASGANRNVSLGSAASTLRNSLTETANSSALTNEAKLNQLQVSANTFLSDPPLLGTREALEAATPGYGEFYLWLQRNKSSLDHATLVPRTGALTALTTVQRDALWDNLIAQEIAGGDPIYREAAAVALLVDGFLSAFAGTSPATSAEEFRQFAEARLLLPKEIFPLPGTGNDPGPPPPLPDPDPVVQEVEAALQKLDEYQVVYDALVMYYENALQAQARLVSPEAFIPPEESLTAPNSPNLPETPPTPPDLGEILLDANARTALGPATVAVLDELKVGPEVPFDHALARIERAAARITTDTFGKGEMTRKVVNFGGALWTLNTDNAAESQPNGLVPNTLSELKDTYGGLYPKDNQPRIRPLGIADLRRVEHKLCCYVPGEVAHIENIMQGEYKERSVRRLRRTEETFSLTTETETTDDRETTTTDRFELEKETSKTIEQDSAQNYGMEISGGFGPVKTSFSAELTSSESSVNSDEKAVKYAREITERSLQRIVERIRAERTRKVIEEFEENTQHGLDNRLGDKHVTGLYRWVDKLYEAKVVNYGKRLMFEFFVPEPGAFHLWNMSHPDTPQSVTLREPADPRTDDVVRFLGWKLDPLRTAARLNRTNYILWASTYGASVNPPPPEFIEMSRTYGRDNIGVEEPFADHFNDFEIPEGYETVWVDSVSTLHRGHSPFDHWISLTVLGTANYQNRHLQRSWRHHPRQRQEGAIPMSIVGRTKFYSVTLLAKCKLKEELYRKWQLETYDAILAAYFERRAEYESELEAIRANDLNRIPGSNPVRNREIERIELKKHCIQWLHYNQEFHHSGVSMQNYFQVCKPPVIATGFWTIDAGRRVKFFEQAFDWELMTYRFFPYFWGAKCRWKKLYQLQDADPLFLNFLQSGMARVLVPVAPGMESYVLDYLATGEIHNGSNKLQIDNDLGNAILSDLRTTSPQVEGTWELRVPTTLTVLQCDSGCIAGDGLPCDCGNGIGTANNASLTPVETSNSTTSP